MDARRPGGIRRAARFVLSGHEATKWVCDDCRRRCIDVARNCDGSRPMTRPIRIELPGDRRDDVDVWDRCPIAEIDPGILTAITLYWDARAEGVPLLPPPIDRWPANTLRLSRIMREIAHQVAQSGTEVDAQTQGQAAAEIKRQQLRDDILAGRR